MGYETGIAPGQGPEDQRRRHSPGRSWRPGASFDLVNRPRTRSRSTASSSSVNPLASSRRRPPPLAATRSSRPVCRVLRRSGNGQLCTKPGLAFVPAGAGREDRGVAARPGREGGPGTAAQRAHLGPGYFEAIADRLVIGRATVTARARRGGRDPSYPRCCCHDGPELWPTRRLTQECFGPLDRGVRRYGGGALAAARVFDGTAH